MLFVNPKYEYVNLHVRVRALRINCKQPFVYFTRHYDYNLHTDYVQRTMYSTVQTTYSNY